MIRLRPHRRPAGFTLIEVLVVIGIIVVLIGILVPVVLRARIGGVRARIALDLQTIATALQAYHDDFGDYPRPEAASMANVALTPDPPTGAEILCRALIGPAPQRATGTTAIPIQDGNDGPGFRLRRDPATNLASGRVYGPYLPADKFRLADYNPPMTPFAAGSDISFRLSIMLDDGTPVLYFPARTGARQPQLAYDAPNGVGVYDPAHNAVVNSGTAALTYNPFGRGESTANAAIRRIQAMLGDLDGDGKIGAGETAAATADFILWAAGPDGKFGPEAPLTATPTVGPTSAEVNKCDDVTNFR